MRRLGRVERRLLNGERHTLITSLVEPLAALAVGPNASGCTDRGPYKSSHVTQPMRRPIHPPDAGEGAERSPPTSLLPRAR